ncbi:hypothetical protein GCM10007301_10370 [Azorhizobium oxalatiphilum]|uniref:Uncharacterized protein n=1 Tax=Azorhizobium oxalatiphilum TaxID=980631 RepID=A0A917BPY8_9HYPH|nr:hypothetical protein GCM10007301_10370 [Azorhizobium oxalatiphilum]
MPRQVSPDKSRRSHEDWFCRLSPEPVRVMRQNSTLYSLSASRRDSRRKALPATPAVTHPLFGARAGFHPLIDIAILNNVEDRSLGMHHVRHGSAAPASANSFSQDAPPRFMRLRKSSPARFLLSDDSSEDNGAA